MKHIFFFFFFVTCMRTSMYLEVFQPGETLATHTTLVRLLVCVCANVNQHLVSALSRKSCKFNGEISSFFNRKMFFLTLIKK